MAAPSHMSTPPTPEDELLAVQLAVREVQEKTWGTTEDYLESNEVECDSNGDPVIARVDSTSKPGG